jgi:hypothetical protein
LPHALHWDDCATHTVHTVHTQQPQLRDAHWGWRLSALCVQRRIGAVNLVPQQPLQNHTV